MQEKTNDLILFIIFVKLYIKSHTKIKIPLNYLESCTKYLRQTLAFMWNSALRENLNVCFSRDFY